MTDDEVIDETLKELGGKYKQGVKLRTYIPVKFHSDNIDKRLIIDIMEAKGLIVSSSEPDKHVITQFGRDVNNEGGWVKYIENERENKRIREQKFRDDALVSAWLVRSKWWPLRISIASFLVSLAVLAWTIWTSE